MTLRFDVPEALLPRLKRGRPAIVDGVYQGSYRQMLVLVAAIRIRNEMEALHAGICPEPDAIVRWPGGECRFADAAKLRPEWVNGFAKTMSRQIAMSIARVEHSLRIHDVTAIKAMVWDLGNCLKWVLPEADPARISQHLGLATSASKTASGRRRGAEDRLKRLGIGRAYIEAFLFPYTVGNTAPLEAAERGEDVTIEDGVIKDPWSDMAPVSDPEMMTFNIGLSDAILASVRAMDQANGWDHEDEPSQLQIFSV